MLSDHHRELAHHIHEDSDGVGAAGDSPRSGTRRGAVASGFSNGLGYSLSFKIGRFFG